ncbi:MAG: 3-carboxy-cis,cis-muconate cycloisomerase [Acidobacteriaceae bacterium]
MPGKKQEAEVLSSLFSTEEMDGTFSLTRQLQCMTRFEWALSAALEANGLSARGSSAAFEPLLDAGFVDIPVVLHDAQRSGNLAIPFVGQLTAALRSIDPAAAASVHSGATSQDVLDTALVLQMRDAIEILRRDLDSLEDHLLRQTRTHADTLLAGRTLLQDAPPVTLGLKLAGYIEALRRHRERLDASARRALVLQFGGATGTLAALGDKGTAVSAELARRLELEEPRIPWHTHRDNLVELASCLALLVATLGKFARDISLLMQTEVGEVLEPAGEGRGGSSTMPHKRNPVASAIILAAAARTPGLVSTLFTSMIQEHERGLGGWHAEWETVPAIFRLTAVALARSIEIAGGLEVHPERMLANMDATRGLVMAEAVAVALCATMDRDKAHALVERAVARAQSENRHLREILFETPEIRACLDETQINRLFDPRQYLGSTRAWIARVTGDSDGGR